jgi:xanthine dehydrogenase iron-sulfur cluster and FAD-binding subunit A
VALSAVLCRCTGYLGIGEAVAAAAASGEVDAPASREGGRTT